MTRRELLRSLGDGRARRAISPGAAPVVRSLEEVKRAHVREILRQTGGHRARTAEILGIAPRTLYNYLQREAPGEAA